MIPEQRYERLIRAAPEQVFDAFTGPDGQREFYGKDEPGWIVESECDLRVGGVWDIRFGPGPGEIYRHRHVFEEIERSRRLRLTCTETRPDGSSLAIDVEFNFEPHDGGTLMTMTQSGFATEALREEHGRGVPEAFDRLERELARSRH